jgi:hypothetical protein
VGKKSNNKLREERDPKMSNWQDSEEDSYIQKMKEKEKRKKERKKWK